MSDTPKAQLQTPLPEDIWVPALNEAGVAFAAAALLLAIFYVFAFRWIHPEFVPFMDREATKLVAPGKDLIPVSLGGYRVEGSTAIIEGFNGDEAILALPRSFQAEDYPFIKVNLQGFTRYSKFKILWRQADNLAKTHALEFNRSGDGVTQIAMVYGSENYRGRIADLALLFYDGPALGVDNNNDVDLIFKNIEFRPFSVRHVMEQIFEDWTNPPLLRAYSINLVRGIHYHGMVLPNAAANLLLITGLGVAVLIRGLRRWAHSRPPCHLLATALWLCFCAWAFNDVLRWHWRMEQLADTNERYAELPLEKRIRNSDIRCARFPADCAAHFLPYF